MRKNDTEARSEMESVVSDGDNNRGKIRRHSSTLLQPVNFLHQFSRNHDELNLILAFFLFFISFLHVDIYPVGFYLIRRSLREFPLFCRLI